MKVLIILRSVKAAELPPFGKELLILITEILRLFARAQACYMLLAICYYNPSMTKFCLRLY